MKPTRTKTTLLVVVIVATVLGVMVTHHLKKPLPSPKVRIEFQELNMERTRAFHLKKDTNHDEQIVFSGDSEKEWWFRVSSSQTNIPMVQTNVICTLYLTNCGSTRIWWLAVRCDVEARTPYGWITNSIGHMTMIPGSVAPSRSEVFSMYVPSDAIEWRVTGSYQYYKQHHMRLELAGWFFDDLNFGTKRPPRILALILGYSLEAIAWSLGLLPEPREVLGEVYSAFFTNKPPTVLPPLGQPLP